jgi:hypothetical protein
MTDLIDVLIEAPTDLDWCADPSELERARQPSERLHPDGAPLARSV